MLAEAAALLRAGVVRPAVPRPRLLRALWQAPLQGAHLGTVVSLHAGTRPDGVALEDDHGTMTWRELDQRCSQLAHVLLDHASPGGRAASMVRNGRQAVEFLIGCARAGLVAVPFNTWWRGDELAHAVSVQQPSLVVVDPEFAPRLAGADVALIRTGSEYEDALGRAPHRVPRVRGAGRVVVHTSGTTGRAKGAERDLGQGGLGAVGRLLAKIPMRADSTVLILPPLFHTFAQGLLGVATVLGATVILPGRFEPERTTAVLLRSSVVVLVPTMLQRLLEAGATGRPTAVVVSGSPLRQDLRRRAEAVFGDVVYDLYGSTEVGWATIGTPEDRRERPGTVGRAGPGMRVMAVDEDGAPLPAGEVGELHVMTGWEFDGYTGGEKPRSRLRGAIGMGDLGWVDADGYVFVIGRADDVIIVGGENVNPGEVEDVLERHPLVTEAAVVGDPDDTYGEVPHAYVAAIDVDPRELQEWVADRLASFKVPKAVTVVAELPRNATGKVLRKRLADLQ